MDKVVLDKVAMRFILLGTLRTSVLSGDGKVVVLIIKATVEGLTILLITRISTTRPKVIQIKDTRNTTMQKNSTAADSRNITARKDKPKNSIMLKLVIKEPKRKELRMPIGLRNLASDIMSQRKKNSTSQIMVL